jgi:hypothetical protein
MKNFQFLFAAWMSVWAAFFIYEILIARRVSRLKDEIHRLNQRLREDS